MSDTQLRESAHKSVNSISCLRMGFGFSPHISTAERDLSSPSGVTISRHIWNG
jgi:hypothetical protein